MLQEALYEWKPSQVNDQINDYFVTKTWKAKKKMR